MSFTCELMLNFCFHHPKYYLTQHHWSYIGLVYGVYISQLIRYARASSNYSDFLKRHLHLRNRLLDQGYKKIRLIRSLKKFIFRYQYLVEIYSVSAEKIISDANVNNFFVNVWRKSIFDIYVTEYDTALTTILPILFLYLNTVTVTAGTFEP
jgi:hypothetical protein